MYVYIIHPSKFDFSSVCPFKIRSIKGYFFSSKIYSLERRVSKRPTWRFRPCFRCDGRTERGERSLIELHHHILTRALSSSRNGRTKLSVEVAWRLNQAKVLFYFIWLMNKTRCFLGREGRRGRSWTPARPMACTRSCPGTPQWKYKLIDNFRYTWSTYIYWYNVKMVVLSYRKILE